jgi:pyruvate formate lyase activating enzyme
MTSTAILFNVQQFSTEDGPGIRTTAFFKGCPLHCDWCHNPEGMRSTPELMWFDTRCIAARECLRVCTVNALELTLSGMQINRSRCTVCGDCSRACPAAALEVIGRSWTAIELHEVLMKDTVFYDTSGGGVTFSGGEPILQADFLGELLPLCKESGLHTALDTCGALPWQQYAKVLPYIDLVLFDLKIMETERHQRSAGQANHQILENACRIAQLGIPMWVRTPIIPGYTNDPANISAIGRFIQDKLPNVQRWDLLAYTNLGRPKYHRLDRAYLLEDAALLYQHEMEALYNNARQLVPSARWSGATR